MYTSLSSVLIEDSLVPIRYKRARDIIIAINGTRIVNSDNLSSYLEENALPNQTINVTIVRNGQTMNVPLVLGA